MAGFWEQDCLEHNFYERAVWQVVRSTPALGVMNLEPPNLGVPLYRRDWKKVLLPLMAGAVAWLWDRPTAIPQAAISFFVGGAVIWFAFASSLSYRMGHHRVPLIRGLWVAVIVLGVVWFMRVAIPYLHALA